MQEKLEWKLKEGFSFWEPQKPLDDKKRVSMKQVPKPTRLVLKVRSKESEIFTQRILKIAPFMKEFIPYLEYKAEELNLLFDHNFHSVSVYGKERNVEEFVGYLYEIKSRNAKEEPKIKDSQGIYTQVELPLSQQLRARIEKIINYANDLELIVDHTNDVLFILGFANRIATFIEWLQDLMNSLKDRDIVFDLQFNSTKYLQKKLPINVFQRIREKDIIKKANELDLDIEIQYDWASIEGTLKNISLFQTYLNEIEVEERKKNYPKYWDFTDLRPFALIDIAPGSEEYKEISNLFLTSMNNFTIVRIQRIQNKRLLELYVMMVQQWKEKNPGQDPNRQMLFHGTRTTKPEVIYTNSGLDLQYARFGSYGKGLYFGGTAAVSHGGYVHTTSAGTFQLLIMDVLLGRVAKTQHGANQLIKAPDGYDSVQASNKNFYIIYRNYHSYPRYLIEYRNGR